MIASVSSGRRFAGLARYLAFTRDGEPTRAAWIVGRNLPDDDPLLAAKVMQANAAANARVHDPVYHVALAFDPGDPVTRRDMERAADRVLRDVGLAEYQALLVAHDDRAHPHVHLMVNRVHPETGRAWDRAHDYRRLEVSLRALERELGLRVVPGRHAPVPELAIQVPARDDARLHSPHNDALALASADPRTRGERQREMRTDEVALIARAVALRNVLAVSSNWDDLSQHLNAVGLRLERRGQGLVITDGRVAVKASRVARECAMTRLEARFGVRYDTWQAGRDRSAERTITDRVGARRRPAAEDVMATTITPVTDERADRSARRGPVSPQDLADTARIANYADRAVLDPDRVNPQLARPVNEQPAGARYVAARLAQYEAVLQAGLDAAGARETYARARDAVSDAALQARVAQGTETDFMKALAKAYQDPAAARREIDTSVRQVGIEKTAEMIRKSPEVFSALSKDTSEIAEIRKQFPRIDRERPADWRPARFGAEGVAMRLERVEQTRADAPTADQMKGLLRAVDRAEVAAITAEARLAQLPNGDALARGIARGVARLDDRALEELKATLPVARAELADTFREGAVQALARESAGRVQHLREQVGERLGVSVGAGRAPDGVQLKSAAALHERTARALNDGRELGRVLGSREADVVPATAPGKLGGPERVMAPTDAARVGRDTGGGSRSGTAVESGTVAAPRERVQAADMAARAVQQMVQSLTPEELQGLVGAVRAGAEVVRAMGGAGLGGGIVAAHQAVRAGVARMLSGPEVER